MFSSLPLRFPPPPDQGVMEKERIAIDSTQDPNPGKGSRSPSDEEMESEVEEVMESEVDLYFRVKQRDRKYEWFVIRGDDMSGGNKKELEPAFSSPQPAHLTLFSCSGVVGSTIYVIGGLNPDISHPCVMGKRLGHPLYDEVYCIDTESPEGGWKKEKSMIKPRGYAYTVTVDSKMYVFGNVIKGHNSGSGKEFLMAEVFDATKRTWKALSRSVPRSLKFYQVFGHAVSEDNKTILLHGYDDPNLYKYDIESDSWDIYSKSCVGPEGMRSSALVDGVLYYVDHATLGVMFALDLVNHENKLHEVTGLDEILLPPHLVKYAPGIRLRELLFSLGNSMLAMVWATSVDEFDSERIAICCSKLKMSRQQDDHTGQVTFRAQYLSRSCHPVKGFSIYDGVSVKRQRKAPTPVHSVEEPVVEPPKLTYASILRVAKGPSVPPVAPRPAFTKSTPPASEWHTPQPAALPLNVPESRLEVPEENPSLAEEGKLKSVYVRNLPSTVSAADIEQEFKNFGRITADGVFIRNRKDIGVCYAFVEFEDLQAVQNAVKASPIQLAGKTVYIEERRANSSGVAFRGRGRGRGSYQSDTLRGRGGGRGSGGGNQDGGDFSKSRGNGFRGGLN